MSMSKDSKNQLLVGAGVIIAILLIAVVYLAVQNSKKSKQTGELKSELSEVEMLKADLEEEYTLAQEELEAMKGENLQLDEIISQQQQELEAQKEKIEALLADNRNLNRARAELRKLREQTKEYLAQIDQLKSENEQLSSKNTRLAQSLEMKTTEASELQTAKGVLVKEKEMLEKERKQLKAKVDIASVVEATNIEVIGEMIKENGKVKEKDKAKKIDRLKICFNASDNAVAEPGEERFYIRIIDPRGETIAIESAGSGVLTNNANDEQVRYTTMKEISYDQQSVRTCTLWDESQGFSPGVYNVEVYNKGHLSGQASFEMK